MAKKKAKLPSFIKSIWLPLFIILLISLSISIYYNSSDILASTRKNKKPQAVSINTALSRPPTPTPTPIAFGAKFDSADSFQDILSASCEDNMLTKPELLPFTYNDIGGRLKSTIGHYPVTCPNMPLIGTGTQDNPIAEFNLIIAIPTSNSRKNNIYIYSPNTRDNDHGGWQYFNWYMSGDSNDALGLNFYNTDTIEGRIYLPIGFGLQQIDNTKVYMNMRKTMYLPSGEKYYIEQTRVAIPSTDKRLTNLLIKHAGACDERNPMVDTTRDSFCVQNQVSAEIDVLNTFFSDINSLDFPESEVFSEMLDLLDSFSNSY